jgi:hypothetical protein
LRDSTACHRHAPLLLRMLRLPLLEAIAVVL